MMSAGNFSQSFFSSSPYLCRAPITVWCMMDPVGSLDGVLKFYRAAALLRASSTAFMYALLVVVAPVMASVFAV